MSVYHDVLVSASLASSVFSLRCCNLCLIVFPTTIKRCHFGVCQ